MKCRFFILTAFLFIIGWLYMGCSDAENNSVSEEPSIEMEGEVDVRPVIGSDGGTSTVTFTASGNWTASVNAVTRTLDWLSVSPTQGGAGTVTLQISAQPNESYDERNAAVLLTCGNAQQTITVTQKQKDALLVNSHKVEMDAEGGTFDIELQANVNVTYEIEESTKSWLSAVSSSTRGLTTSTLNFQVAENPEESVRQAVITLRGNDLTEQVTVYQAGSEPAILLSQKEYTVPSDGETIQVELKSNTSYKVVMPDAPWITETSTRAFSAYTHYFTVAANENYDARTAEVVFVSEGDGTIADTVRIYQAYKGAIVVAQQEYEVKAEGDQLDFQVQTNLELEVSISDDWIKRVEARTRGLVEKQLCFNIEPNESDTLGREATITLRGKDTGISQNILVKQPAYVPVLDTVIYRTGYTWEEAHDNLPLLYYAHVERERIYTNGKIFTDRFVDVGHPVELHAGCNLIDATDPSSFDKYEYNFGDWNESIVYHRELINGEFFYPDITDLGFHNDSILVYNCAVEVDNPNKIVVEEQWEDDLQSESYPGKWDEYVVSKLYNDNEYLFISPDEFRTNHEITNLQSGWYFQGFAGKIDQSWMYYNQHAMPIYRVNMFFRCYDQFLVIDGRKIDFLHYLPEREFSMTVEDLPDTENYIQGKRYIRMLNARFMGRNFQMSTVMDFYAAKDKYTPGEIYYFGGSGGNNEYNNWPDSEQNWYFHLSDGNAISQNFVIEANDKPIICTDADWITINSIDKGEKVDTPVQLDVYKWIITWTPSCNSTGNYRNGYIYVLDRQGNVKRKAYIAQWSIFEE